MARGTPTASEFDTRLTQLKADLVTQGARVLDLVLRAVDSYFTLDLRKAGDVVSGDDVIDRADVEIERASIPLLSMGVTDEHAIRSVLTIVKINNELERIADCAVNIAEMVKEAKGQSQPIPGTFRVMANSVIGMLRDSNKALATVDVALAERVLSFDDTVDRFKREIIVDAQEDVVAGRFDVQFAFRLMAVTKLLERIADHCTNMCEQIIYLESGLIVRHLPEGWTKPAKPS
jgi:phosphate transport system protein